MRILCFDFDESSQEKPGKPPYDGLKQVFARSPAVPGPLDMGYLTHNPNHKHQGGADHFVLAHKIEKDEIYFRDPEGFPNVQLPLKQMELAWRAEKIPYRRGHYRYWANPRRVKFPHNDSIYRKAMESFKQGYLESSKISGESKLPMGKAAILALAQHVHEGPVTASQRGFMAQFSFRLGARRALDFASFFEKRNRDLPPSSELRPNYSAGVTPFPRTPTGRAYPESFTVSRRLRTSFTRASTTPELISCSFSSDHSGLP